MTDSQLTPLLENSTNDTFKKNNSLSSDIVVFRSYPNDQNSLIGSLCIVLYLGLWFISHLSVPVTVILYLYGYKTLPFVMSIIIGLCYMVPVYPINSLRICFRRRLSSYFKEVSIQFEYIPDAQSDRPTILCISPHGIYSYGWVLTYLTDHLIHLNWCFSTLLNFSPLFRVLIRLCGKPSDIRKKTIINLMKRNESFAIIPGGWHEATIHSHKCDRIYIKNRTGFIKYALEYGYTVTPTFVFGEKSTYSNVQGCYNARFWLNAKNILTVIPWGLSFIPFLPRKTKLNIVIGSPINMEHIKCPSKQDVDKWHQLYIDKVITLFENHKFDFYGPNANSHKLEIW